jgi:hypothetical protein
MDAIIRSRHWCPMYVSLRGVERVRSARLVVATAVSAIVNKNTVGWSKASDVNTRMPQRLRGVDRTAHEEHPSGPGAKHTVNRLEPNLWPGKNLLWLSQAQEARPVRVGPRGVALNKIKHKPADKNVEQQRKSHECACVFCIPDSNK